MKKVRALLTVMLLVVVGCSGGFTHDAGNLSSLSVQPADNRVPVGRSVTFRATGTYADNIKKVVSSVELSSSAPAVATIDAAGTCTAVAAGTTVITAKVAGLSATTSLTVAARNLVLIEIKPSRATMAVGTSTRLSATGVQVPWRLT